MAEQSPSALLLDNARDFLSRGVEVLYSRDCTSQDAKIAIISIQTAIELLAKYRLVNSAGLESIIHNGQIPSFASLKQPDKMNFRQKVYYTTMYPG